MDLDLEVRSVYGLDKIYPMNQQAKMVAALAGTKTLGTREIALAWALSNASGQGFSINWSGSLAGIAKARAAVEGFVGDARLMKGAVA